MSGDDEQMQQYRGFHRTAFEPYRGYLELALQSWGRLARQNYALLGDYLDFALDGVRQAAEATDIQDYFGKRSAGAQAFGEKLVCHAREYTEIVRGAQDAPVSLAREKK